MHILRHNVALKLVSRIGTGHACFRRAPHLPQNCSKYTHMPKFEFDDAADSPRIVFTCFARLATASGKCRHDASNDTKIMPHLHPE